MKNVLDKIVIEGLNNCDDCMKLKKFVHDFQTHNHTFLCQKKNKVLTIKKDEGHGRNDGGKKGQKISNYVQCRFNFPQFPLNKTTFILGLPENLDKNEVQKRREDLNKINKYIIRQTYIENVHQDKSSLNYFQSLSFIKFLREQL